MSQIYYELDCSAFMCYFEVRINDVCVFSLNVDGQAAMDVPINNGILEKGEQDIEIRVSPLSGGTKLHKESYVRYKVIEYDVSSGDFKFIQQFENFQTAPVQENIPFIIHKSVFMSNVSYKLDAWQNGVNLKDVKFDLKKALLSECNLIIDALNNKNYDFLRDKLANKEKNIAIAMYLKPSESKSRISQIIDEIEDGFRAMPIDNNVYIEYSAYNKLATLKRLNRMSALYLENSKTNEEIVLDISFCGLPGKKEFEIF
ncbi:MAG: hypothetical protein REI96_01155 [Flavobacterium nitrogenifigens]|uniref:hypothetical protein n=1 Tax=Flavobacterium nitrogenifigens TaxID=1617283 RepID=UPI0028080E0A|nr:hypothetical protein [Flavobacterium nitrogenifigens]MDQ8011026.1 hypothetical protein [Flavobacterium nitrogenifigens]